MKEKENLCSWFIIHGQAAHIGGGKSEDISIYVFASNAVDAMTIAQTKGGWRSKGQISVLPMDKETESILMKILDERGFVKQREPNFSIASRNRTKEGENWQLDMLIQKRLSDKTSTS